MRRRTYGELDGSARLAVAPVVDTSPYDWVSPKRDALACAVYEVIRHGTGLAARDVAWEGIRSVAGGGFLYGTASETAAAQCQDDCRMQEVGT